MHSCTHSLIRNLTDKVAALDVLAHAHHAFGSSTDVLAEGDTHSAGGEFAHIGRMGIEFNDVEALDKTGAVAEALGKKNIAMVFSTAEENVNVKATTEEKLGFTGSGEGMACHAVCLLEERN